MSEQASQGRERGHRKTVTGKVVSDKMAKTITVTEERMVPHPLYRKYVRRATRYKAHDERGEAQVGDVVEIAPSRPLSKSKRWRLVRVIRSDRMAGAQPAEAAFADLPRADETPEAPSTPEATAPEGGDA